MNASEIIDEFSVKIYEEPLAHLRDSGGVADLSNPVAIVMLLVDFRTEVEMNGITDFIGNSTGLFAAETVEALQRIGCSPEAERLRMILEAASGVGMTHEAIQADRAGLEEFSVTTFRKLHGKKWDQALSKMDELMDLIDFSVIFENVQEFVEQHRYSFEEAIR